MRNARPRSYPQKQARRASRRPRRPPSSTPPHPPCRRQRPAPTRSPCSSGAAPRSRSPEAPRCEMLGRRRPTRTNRRRRRGGPRGPCPCRPPVLSSAAAARPGAHPARDDARQHTQGSVSSLNAGCTCAICSVSIWRASFGAAGAWYDDAKMRRISDLCAASCARQRNCPLQAELLTSEGSGFAAAEDMRAACDRRKRSATAGIAAMPCTRGVHSAPLANASIAASSSGASRERCGMSTVGESSPHFLGWLHQLLHLR